MRIRKRPIHNTERNNICWTPPAYEYLVGDTFKCECGIEYELVRNYLEWWKPTNTGMSNGIPIPISGHPVYVPTAAWARRNED